MAIYKDSKKDLNDLDINYSELIWADKNSYDKIPSRS